MTGAGEQLLAHHVALFAIPAVVPAIIVVGIVLYLVRKDRREERQEQQLMDPAFEHTDSDESRDA